MLTIDAISPETEVWVLDEVSLDGIIKTRIEEVRLSKNDTSMYVVKLDSRYTILYADHVYTDRRSAEIAAKEHRKKYLTKRIESLKAQVEEDRINLAEDEAILSDDEAELKKLTDELRLSDMS